MNPGSYRSAWRTDKGLSAAYALHDEQQSEHEHHAILINVTRGAIVFGDDLLAALDEGLIGGAGLDVTDPEPLPAGHKLWTPRALVTPHTAGGSPRRAGRVIATFIENLRRRRDGGPLLALIDKQKGD
jgi:phosphoglycerate dehydrogenase-like enzyme